MQNDIAVLASHISKSYSLNVTTKQKLSAVFNTRHRGREFLALHDVSFEVKTGEVIGFIGLNGSGKSTLANIIAGTAHPTTGEIEVNGEVSMLAASSGMNNELTGRQNIELKCIMMGFTNAMIKELTHEIIEFADIGLFIDQPFRTYSSGMKSRLGFAISVCVDPEILIIDEALSVGDSTFVQRCLDKMMEFKESGKTVFFVSHGIEQMRGFCDKVMWLHKGELIAFDQTDLMLEKYKEFTVKYLAQ